MNVIFAPAVREAGSVMHRPRFYFTMHPGDLIRDRILPGASIMLVASAHWNPARGAFDVRRPPADHIGTLCIDSGGYTAAARWGKYPWSPAQYAEWVRETVRDIGLDRLDFVACMDYACEPSVNRSIYRSNRARITATIRNERACRKADLNLPWLPVLQGDSLAERAFDLDMRSRLGMLPDAYAGIGSVCGRGVLAAREVVKFYLGQLMGVQYHAFGMHVQALDDDAVFGAVRSWDSYSWNWGRGQKDLDRPKEYYRREDETWTQLSGRLARLYWERTVLPRLARKRQGLLL